MLTCSSFLINGTKEGEAPRPLQSQLNLVVGFIHCSSSNTINTQELIKHSTDSKLARWLQSRYGYWSSCIFIYKLYISIWADELCELMRNGVWCIPVLSGTLKNTLSVAGAAERISDKCGAYVNAETLVSKGFNMEKNWSQHLTKYFGCYIRLV
ncbi:hypothetical protein C5167_021681 [Papaver somniferum]|uniref:Uncharacterized protein n=1 Tax=Papaver somniferum TaxID=3469 RepID=A0A4Y7JJ09_PAPSO|nr:hypothetical protein C5167_021681 [Papaver somniferum]